MDGWQRVGEEIIKRRVELGHNSREAFSRESGLSPRLLSDIERGRRESYDPATLVRLERALRWLPGSVQAILGGGEPTPVPEVDTRLVEREGDDLALMSLLAQSGLARQEALAVVMYIRGRRAQQYDELVAEVRGLIEDMGGTPPPTSPGAPQG